jgi:hypothetical protein
MQTTMAIKRPMEMFLSTYELRRGLESMRGILMDPLREDDRDKTFVSLKPAESLTTHIYSLEPWDLKAIRSDSLHLTCWLIYIFPG